MHSIDGVPAQATGLLTISLGAVAANWRRLRALTGPACTVAAVVKAQAYGLGAIPVAEALLAVGCRCFFLATVDEGIELRRVVGRRDDVTLAILCGPAEETAELFVTEGLTPVLNDLGQIALWRRVAAGRPAILNLDTGMSRLGLSALDIERLALDPSRLEGMPVSLVMSHLACADEPEHPLNESQRDHFERLTALLPPGPRSLAASSGIFHGPRYHYQLVRPGAALYGINPTPGQPNPMDQVVDVKAKILQVREIDANVSVGYGATHTTRTPTRIAILGAGYADGYLRAGSNRASVRIGVYKAPVIGRISMDLTTVDVSDIPAALVSPGIWASVIGPDHDVDAVARDGGTIGYEVLTRLSSRLHRIYLA
jgi:alanine racemase